MEILQRRFFSTLLIQHDIWKIQENLEELKLNGTHHLLVYADDANLLGGKIDTIKNNTKTLINSSKEDINIANRSSKI
jgi:hypothetical protein